MPEDKYKRKETLETIVCKSEEVNPHAPLRLKDGLRFTRPGSEEIFEIEKQLGEGGQGEAYLITLKDEGGNPIKKKTLKKFFFNPGKGISGIEEELLKRVDQISKVLGEDNLVYRLDPYHVAIEQQFVEGIDLKQYMRTKANFTEREAIHLLYSIFVGNPEEISSGRLGKLHGAKQVHGDMNPRNIIIDNSGDELRYTLIDFDTLREHGKSVTMNVEQIADLAFCGSIGEHVIQNDYIGMAKVVQYVMTGKMPEYNANDRARLDYEKRVMKKINASRKFKKVLFKMLGHKKGYKSTSELIGDLESLMKKESLEYKIESPLATKESKFQRMKRWMTPSESIVGVELNESVEEIILRYPVNKELRISELKQQIYEKESNQISKDSWIRFGISVTYGLAIGAMYAYGNDDLITLSHKVKAIGPSMIRSFIVGSLYSIVANEISMGILKSSLEKKAERMFLEDLKVAEESEAQIEELSIVPLNISENEENLNYLKKMIKGNRFVYNSNNTHYHKILNSRLKDIINESRYGDQAHINKMFEREFKHESLDYFSRTADNIFQEAMYRFKEGNFLDGKEILDEEMKNQCDRKKRYLHNKEDEVNFKVKKDFFESIGLRYAIIKRFDHARSSYEEGRTSEAESYLRQAKNYSKIIGLDLSEQINNFRKKYNSSSSKQKNSFFKTMALLGAGLLSGMEGIHIDHKPTINPSIEEVVDLNKIPDYEPATEPSIDDFFDLEGEEVLVYSSSEGIYLVDYDGSVHQIANEERSISDLKSVGKKLYYSCNYSNEIFDILDKRVAYTVERMVKDFHFLAGDLYYMDGSYDNGWKYEIIKVKLSENSNKEEVLLSDLDAHVFGSHKGRIYFGGVDGNISDVYSGEIVFDDDNGQVHDITSHNGNLYYLNFYGDVYNVLNNKLIIGLIDYGTRAMTSYNGKLVIARSGGHREKDGEIYDVFSGRTIFDTGDKIKNMVSHPRQAFVEAGILEPKED